VICGDINHCSFPTGPPVFHVAKAIALPPIPLGTGVTTPPPHPGIGDVPTVICSQPEPPSGLTFNHPAGGNAKPSKDSLSVANASSIAGPITTLGFSP